MHFSKILSGNFIVIMLPYHGCFHNQIKEKTSNTKLDHLIKEYIAQKKSIVSKYSLNEFNCNFSNSDS